jgi:hypothetical protein
MTDVFVDGGLFDSELEASFKNPTENTIPVYSCNIETFFEKINHINKGVGCSSIVMNIIKEKTSNIPRLYLQSWGESITGKKPDLNLANASFFNLATFGQKNEKSNLEDIIGTMKKDLFNRVKNTSYDYLSNLSGDKPPSIFHGPFLLDALKAKDLTNNCYIKLVSSTHPEASICGLYLGGKFLGDGQFLSIVAETSQSKDDDNNNNDK